MRPQAGWFHHKRQGLQSDSSRPPGLGHHHRVPARGSWRLWDPNAGLPAPQDGLPTQGLVPYLTQLLHTPPSLLAPSPVCWLFVPFLSSSPSEGLSPPLPAPSRGSLIPPSFSQSPLQPHSSAPLSTQEEGARKELAVSSQAGHANPIPPVRGKRGRLGARGHRRPSRGEARLGLPGPPGPSSQSHSLEHRGGLRTLLPCLCSSRPGPGSQEGHCIWPEQNL